MQANKYFSQVKKLDFEYEKKMIAIEQYQT